MNLKKHGDLAVKIFTFDSWSMAYIPLLPPYYSLIIALNLHRNFMKRI